MSFAMIEEHTLDAKEILRAREALIELSNYCEEAEFFCEEAKEDGSCQHERCQQRSPCASPGMVSWGREPRMNNKNGAATASGWQRLWPQVGHPAH